MMSPNHTSTVNGLALVLLAMATLPADAKERREREQNELPAAVRKIERETGAQVLRAERIDLDGRNINRIKFITPEGRVRVYRDDRSRVSSEEQEYERNGRR